MSSTIRVTPPQSYQKNATANVRDEYWARLGASVRKGSVEVPVCVLALHFESCPLTTPEEREAHLECELCDVSVVYDEC